MHRHGKRCGYLGVGGWVGGVVCESGTVGGGGGVEC